MKQSTSPGLMHETGCSGPVHWDDPEGWDEEGGGRGVQDREHVYTHGWFISMHGKNHHSILAWRISGTEKPVGLLSMRSHRVRHD